MKPLHACRFARALPQIAVLWILHRAGNIFGYETKFYHELTNNTIFRFQETQKSLSLNKFMVS